MILCSRVILLRSDYKGKEGFSIRFVSENPFIKFIQKIIDIKYLICYNFTETVHCKYSVS